VKAIVVGAGGQVGWELRRQVPAGIELDALDRSALDLRDPELAARIAERAPDVIINAAAYTAVDRAESERELARAVNAEGAAALARAAHATGARLVHISTDFVFDGSSPRPYRPDDPPNPLGEYGTSKLLGERAVTEETRGSAVIVRTAWVYSAHGYNFVKTMLRLMTERDSLRVVADQVGTPSWAHLLAAALWEIALRPEIGGPLHWTDLGVASWYDFAVAIQEEALALGLLARPIAIEPIRSEDYPTPARRPAFSVLDKTLSLRLLGAERMHWREALRRMLRELKTQRGLSTTS
jgi:dTDP-4-dehydrorhamnose reductase